MLGGRNQSVGYLQLCLKVLLASLAGCCGLLGRCLQAHGSSPPSITGVQLVQLLCQVTLQPLDLVWSRTKQDQRASDTDEHLVLTYCYGIFFIQLRIKTIHRIRELLTDTGKMGNNLCYC